jgi:hypothetical protein
MQVDMELSRRTWTAAIRLALLMSVAAALIAVGVSSVGDVPQAAVVLPVIVVAFTASWVQTGRLRRERATVPLRAVRRALPIA